MEDWNKLTLKESVEYLREKHLVDSSGDAKCISNLIQFYDEQVKNLTIPDVMGMLNKMDSKIDKINSNTKKRDLFGGPG